VEERERRSGLGVEKAKEGQFGKLRVGVGGYERDVKDVIKGDRE
jgi:hypothetical protein